MRAYLVGGAVRDRLLSLPVADRDWLVVGASVDDMLNNGFVPVGRDFPVFLHPQTKEEYALARTEKKSGVGYKGFEFYTSPQISVEQDLERRDFTINAIAQDGDTGELIDPFGGLDDIDNRIIRHVSSAFSEDPLRVLRAARFAARFASLGFSIHPDTLTLMNKIAASGELSTLSAERLWQEFDRSFRGPTPSVFLSVLKSCRALAGLSKPIDDIVDADALTAIDATPAETALRYAQLWYSRAAKPSWLDIAAKQLSVPRYASQLARRVLELHTVVASIADADDAAIMSLLDKLDAWRQPEPLEHFLTVCEIRLNPANAALVRQCYRAAQSVDVGMLRNLGYTGPALGQQIRDQRLALISASRRDKPLN